MTPHAAAGQACGCAGTVPVVSRGEALARLNRLPRAQRHAALQAALAWLVARHDGLSLYAGINGRPYAGGEAAAIARDVPVVAGLPCPFATPAGECLIGGVPPSRSRRGPYGWLPTWVATLWAKDDYRELVSRGAVADAKVALLSRNEGLTEGVAAM